MSNSTADENNEIDVKKHRLEHPSGWMTLVRYETIRFLIDALLETPPDGKLNKSELSRRTGMSRNSISSHIELLVDLGVVSEVDDSGWAEYKLNDSGRVTTELFELNSAVNAVLTGQSKNIREELEVSLSHIDRSDWVAAQRLQKKIRSENAQ